MSDWLHDYYAAVDAKDLDAYLANHTDDAVVRFANNPPAVGREQIGAAIGGIFAAVESTKHDFTEVHTSGNTAIVEADVEYRLGDGRAVRIPTAAFLRREGELVAELRVYTDLTPVFAPEEAMS